MRRVFGFVQFIREFFHPGVVPTLVTLCQLVSQVNDLGVELAQCLVGAVLGRLQMLEMRDCSRMKQRGDKFGNFFVFPALTISKKGGEPPKRATAPLQRIFASGKGMSIGQQCRKASIVLRWAFSHISWRSSRLKFLPWSIW